MNDFAGVLDARSIERMTRIAEDVRTKSRGEIAIVTLPDLKGRDVADVALRIGREWKVGKIGAPGDPTRNAGAVILLVPKETNSDNSGRCYIATGQGTEGFITDATAGTICREATPLFRQRDYSGGLELVTRRVAERFAGEFGFSLDTSLVPPARVRREPRPDDDGGFPVGVLMVVFFLVWILLANAAARSQRRRRRRRRDGCGGGGMPLIIPIPTGGGRGGWGGGGWGGGDFGGGFGGFGGGGGFSGGGGGSSW